MGSISTKRGKRKKISNLKSQISNPNLKSKNFKKNNNRLSTISNQQLTINRLSNYLITFGYCFLIIGAFIFALTFYPVIREELRYLLAAKTGQKSLKNAPIKPVDEDFGIVIPKIGANTRVMANVDPFNPKEYQWLLTKGVAHAKGSSLPNQPGNIFIFAHSSNNWYNANRYNAVFYLINKLEKNDEIIIYYQKTRFLYKVTAKKLVEASTVSYLSPSYQSGSVLTLMTCWPPGTTLKRLIIMAKMTN